jgi:hypothetical protein
MNSKPVNTTDPQPCYTQPITFQPVYVHYFLFIFTSIKNTFRVNQKFTSALTFGNRWSSGIWYLFLKIIFF